MTSDFPEGSPVSSSDSQVKNHLIPVQSKTDYIYKNKYSFSGAFEI